ncbi:MAG: LysR family transcriptional regulator [Actinomycetota bacterium]
MDVHLRDLRYFVAVAEELHFTRAAERLFVSQPALSRQIAKLENDLRVTLLERDRRSVSLTAAGEALLDDARRLLADWDTARRRLGDAAAASEAVLRIGMQTSIGRGILTRLIDGLAERRPGWTVQLDQVSWDDPTAGLGDQTNDVALCWLPILDDDAYGSVPLRTEPTLLAIAKDHDLADREAVVFDEIVDVPLIALPASAGPLRDHWLAEERRNRPAPVAAVASTADETMEAVAAGIGAVLISAGNAPIYDRPGIGFLPVTDLEPSTLALVWNRSDRREVLRDLVDIAERIGGLSDDAPAPSD